jgi:hypothetical protein
MHPSLKMFVIESYTPDKADLLIESFGILDDAQIEAYENGFFEILMEESNVEISETPAQFESLMVRHLTEIVTEHEIKLAAETPLAYLNALCNGILGIQYYLAPDEISVVLESDQDTEEKFSQILELINGLDVDRSLVYLETVNPSLLDKIETIIDGKQFVSKEQQLEETQEHLIIQKLKNIHRFLNIDDLIAVRLINAGVVIGVNFEQYIKYFVNHTEGMDVERMAKEVFTLICMSRDGYADLLGTYSKYSSSLFHGLDQTTKVFTGLNKVVNEFDRYMLQRNALINHPLSESK